MKFRTLLAISAALVLLALTASTALAGTDKYCQSCQEYDGQAIVDIYAFNNLTSYNHYLGTGDRYIGAGEVNVGGTQHGWNEATHSYSGQYHSYAYATDDSGHQITANAHCTY